MSYILTDADRTEAVSQEQAFEMIAAAPMADWRCGYWECRKADGSKFILTPEVDRGPVPRHP